MTQLLEAQKPLETPQRKYICQLTKTSERLRAENSILQHEVQELKKSNSARNERTKGKRIALKDQLLLTTEELKNAVVAIEKEEENKKKRKQQHK